MTVIFVGSNPSNASTTEEPFHGSTRSSKILAEWTKNINVEKRYVNVANQKTENNRALTSAEIKAELPRLAQNLVGADKIVALGKTAAKALTLLRVQFYELPHPSGLNRLLNNPRYVEEKIKGLQDYVAIP